MTSRLFILIPALAALLLPARGAARELTLTLDDGIP